MPDNLKPAAAASLAKWHDMVVSANVNGLAKITHPDAVFRSPAVHSPYHSAAALQLVLGAAVQVFEDFAYHRQFASDDGLNVTLEFSARVGDKQLKGVDLIRFNEDGKIVEFEVMIRPLSGLMALAQAMGAKVGETIPEFKRKA
jgi:hypothetical protein